MGAFSFWHLMLTLILLIVMLVMLIVPLIVVSRLSVPSGVNRFGSPSRSATSRQALIRGLKNYFVFTGRATRSEFWWFLLWAALLYVPAQIFIFQARRSDLSALVPMLVFSLLPCIFYIPMLSIAVRRLQDANRSGLWVLLAFGGPAVVALLVLLAEPTLGDNIDEDDAFS